MTPQSAGPFYQLHEEAAWAHVCLRIELAVSHKPPIHPNRLVNMRRNAERNAPSSSSGGVQTQVFTK